jgi:hypothetical protein
LPRSWPFFWPIQACKNVAAASRRSKTRAAPASRAPRFSRHRRRHRTNLHLAFHVTCAACLETGSHAPDATIPSVVARRNVPPPFCQFLTNILRGPHTRHIHPCSPANHSHCWPSRCPVTGRLYQQHRPGKPQVGARHAGQGQRSRSNSRSFFKIPPELGREGRKARSTGVQSLPSPHPNAQGGRHVAPAGRAVTSPIRQRPTLHQPRRRT